MPFNEKMNVNLTHHDVNWVYNHHKLKGQRYYLKTRVPTIRLISCLPESTKGMDKDFLIVSWEWHDGLHCPTWGGTPGRAFRFRFTTLTIPLFLLTIFVITSSIFTCKLVLILSMLYSNHILTFGEFTNNYSVIPKLNLVNEFELTKILKVENFVHSDG